MDRQHGGWRARRESPLSQRVSTRVGRAAACRGRDPHLGTLLTALVVMSVAVLTSAGSLSAQAGQRVFGTLTDGTSKAPIEGAMLVLLSGEDVAGRVLSASDGSYALAVAAPGRYTLRVDRIGYESSFSDTFDVAPGASVLQDVQARVRAVALRGLDVTGSRRCDAAPEDGGATARVWEEARKALAAATWTSEREMYRFAWLRYVRELGARGRKVLAEERDARNQFTPQPFTATPTDTLAVHGFVRDRGGQLVYDAPDAHVLLSDAFLDTHCLSLDDRTEGERRWIGLRFEPVDGRDVPEVEGVLWLDADTGLLESLEYDYVNLDRRVYVDGDDASGRVDFRALPNGTWVVADWSIRMPRLLERQDEFGRPLRYEVRGYVEEGGTVTRIVDRDGTTLNESTTALRGIVSDSVGAPLPGARVWLDGTSVEAVTDARGSFALDALTPGTRSVRASHPDLALYGHAGTAAEVAVERNTTRQVRLRLSSLTAMVAERCPLPPGAERASLLGRVVSEAGVPVAGAEVRTVWVRREGIAQRALEGSGIEADANGVFTICSVPVDRTVTASASAPDSTTGSEDVLVDEGVRVASLQIELGRDTRRSTATAVRFREVDESLRPWLDEVGFPLRRERALLSLTRPEIQALSHDTLAALLVEVPRVEARQRLTGETQFRLHPTTNWSRTDPPELDRSCELDFFLNGSQVRQRIGQNWEVQLHRMVVPLYVTAVEIFDGARSPVHDASACGSVLLWVDRLRDREDADFTGLVRGRVVGLGQDVSPSDVEVRLDPLGLELEVHDDGWFDFVAVPPALYTIETVVPGWGRWSMEVEIRAGATVEVLIEVEEGSGPPG